MALKLAKLAKKSFGDSHATMAMKAFERGDLERAAADFLNALAEDENNAELYLNLGVVLLQQEKIDKALIAIKRCLELGPYNADAYNAMGVVLFRHEYWGLAEQFFRKTLELEPMHATAKDSLLETLRRKRDGDNLPPPEFDTVLALLETRDPTLSLCLIVKNEEVFLEACLQSVQGVVDEVILVDTGSTDRTVEIAERYGAKVFHFPWIDDFAAARNESLKHATGDWILVLDADEQLDRESIPHLKQAIRSKQNAGYNLIIENFLGEGGESSQTAMLFRLFQNHRGIRFEGIIHEQAMPSAQRTGMPIVATRTRIVHRGYLDQFMSERDKVSRNLNILLKQVEDRPDDPYVHYHVGQTYKIGGEFEKAEQSLLRSLSLLKSQNATLDLAYYPSVYYALSDLYFKHDHPEKALAITEEALSRLRRLPDLLYMKGAILMSMERLQEAIPCFEEARLFKGSILAAGNDPRVPTYKSATALASAHLKLKNLAVAKKWLLTTLEEEDVPSTDTRYNLALILLSEGNAVQAVEQLQKALEIDPDSGSAWAQLGRAHFAVQSYPEAVGAWRRAVELEADVLDVAVLFGEALMRTGDFLEASKLLERKVADSEFDKLAHIFLGIAALCSGAREQARVIWGALADGRDSALDARVLAGVLQLIEGGALSGGAVSDLETPRGIDLVKLVLEYLFIGEQFGEIEALLTALQGLRMPRLSLELARMLARYSLLDEALAFALDAQATAPQDPEVYALLGLLAEYSGQVDDARTMYQAALQINPRDVEVRKKLAGLR